MAQPVVSRRAAFLCPVGAAILTMAALSQLMAQLRLYGVAAFLWRGPAFAPSRNRFCRRRFAPLGLRAAWSGLRAHPVALHLP